MATLIRGECDQGHEFIVSHLVVANHSSDGFLGLMPSHDPQSAHHRVKGLRAEMVGVQHHPEHLAASVVPVEHRHSCDHAVQVVGRAGNGGEVLQDLTLGMIAVQKRECGHHLAHDTGAEIVSLGDGTDDPGLLIVAVEIAGGRFHEHAGQLQIQIAIVEEAQFIPGDFVEVGGCPADWQRFFDIAGPILRDVPLFPTLGTHEIYGPGGRRRYQRYFVRHDHRVAWQAWTWGNVRLLSLDSNEAWEDGDAQHRWLSEQLAEAADDSRIGWIFVFAHHGPVSSGRHGNHEAMEALGIGDALREAGVDLVFSGHDHMYERGDVGGLKYVVSGGGAPLYRINRRLESQLAFQVKHHYVRVTIDGERLDMTTVSVDGEVLERCGFERGSPWECSLEAGIDPGEPPKSRSILWMVLVAVFMVGVGAYGWRRTRAMRG